MATCFLFTEGLDEAQCLCLRLNELGKVDAPLESRSIDAFRALQFNARTMVVLPAASSSLHHIELPWLVEQKARAAIPYGLEESLAQPVDRLHFSFDRQRYQHHRYLVVATDKQFLVDLITQLDALRIHFDSLTLDWFALHENEACGTDTVLLIRSPSFNGALSSELATLYGAQQEETIPLLLFNDSAPSFQTLKNTRIDNLSSVWIAERLFQNEPMNLCQGELRHDTNRYTLRYWYRAAAMIAGIWLLSALVLNMFHYHALTKKIAVIDQKIAVIYREFFPEARQVISPKFRISQLLRGGLSNNDSAALWFLLEKLAHAFKESPSTIEQVRFQSRMLSVTLVTKDFAALDDLEQRLQQEGVKVAQSQASSKKNQVMATLELSL